MKESLFYFMQLVTASLVDDKTYISPQTGILKKTCNEATTRAPHDIYYFMFIGISRNIPKIFHLELNDNSLKTRGDLKFAPLP